MLRKILLTCLFAPSLATAYTPECAALANLFGSHRVTGERNLQATLDLFRAVALGHLLDEPLQKGARVTHVLTKMDIQRLNGDIQEEAKKSYGHTAKKMIAKYGGKIFEEEETIAHTAAKAEIAFGNEVPQFFAFGYPSSQLHILLESGKMSKQQIDYLERFFIKFFSNIPAGMPNSWMKSFNKLVKRAREKP